MAHSHHDHNHSHAPANAADTAFIAGIFLNAGYVAVEFLFGFFYNSLSLISDAGHNLTDVLSLILSLAGFRLMKVRQKGNMSYGYRKASILISLFNSLVLLFTVGMIFYEAAHRFFHPISVPGLQISIVSIIGVAINFASARLFHRHQQGDINIRGAYLHLLADALVSVAVCAAGIVIYFTGLNWIDPLLAILVGFVILKSTWSLTVESVRLSLDGVPNNVDPKAIEDFLGSQDEIGSVHHMHIWALSSSENAMTVHLIIPKEKLEAFQLKKPELREALKKYHIGHATFETDFETSGHDCGAPKKH